MEKNITWEGIEYHSIEHCGLSIADTGISIKSSVNGNYKDFIYQLDYQVNTNRFWEILFFEIRAQVNDRTTVLSFSSDGKGNWFANALPVGDFTGCTDIDISLTPFTNSLPINRLKLLTGQQQKIRVIYIDVLAGQVKPVEQRYEKLSSTQYKYENIPNDFEATISIDESGLVIAYPALFKQISVTGSTTVY